LVLGEDPTASEDQSEQIANLMSMGFDDVVKIRELLAKHKNDVSKVATELSTGVATSSSMAPVVPDTAAATATAERPKTPASPIPGESAHAGELRRSPRKVVDSAGSIADHGDGDNVSVKTKDAKDNVLWSSKCVMYTITRHIISLQTPIVALCSACLWSST
jgi:hypothetical protein